MFWNSYLFVGSLTLHFPGSLGGVSLDECIKNVMNTPYTGTVAITDQGIKCQAWSAQYPNRHARTKDAYFPADGSVEGASNYCRNFEGYGRPWCITVDQRIMWGFCTMRICNGNTVGNVVTLTSPAVIAAPDFDGDSLYDSNIDKLWIIQAPDDQIIRYWLLFALIRSSINCHQDGLRIFDGGPDTDEVWFCGEHLFEIEYNRGESINNVLFIHFYSDYELTAAGFELKFEFSNATNKNCTETILRSSGWIASPDLDGDGMYDFNLDCVWTVRVAPRSVVSFQILYVAIQYTFGCVPADFVEISDDYAALSLLCGFGGERQRMETRSNIMFVQFISNNYLSYEGFNLTYEAIDKYNEICGEVMRGPSGMIVSPDSDGDGRYDNNAICIWHIEVDPDYVIRYRFQDFSVEYSTNCEKDTLWTHEVSVPQSKVSYCGVLSDKDRIEGETTYNDLFIEFRSDDTNPYYYDYLGFNITYSQRKVPEESCGGTLTNISGYITAPDLDGDGYYDFNQFCVWFIQLHRSKFILYQFTFVSIEVTASGCDADYVMIAEVVNDWSCSSCPLYEVFSGRLKWQSETAEHRYEYTYCGYHNGTELERTLTNALQLYFVSDGRVSGSGFNMVYTEVEKLKCDKVITEDSGWIYPEDYNDTYHDNHIFCKWELYAKPGKLIQFQVIYVLIEESEHCIDFYLEIIFVYNPLRTLFDERHCGQKGRQEPVRPRTDWIYIFFYSKPRSSNFLIYYEYVEDLNSEYYFYKITSQGRGDIAPVDLDGNGLYDYNLFMDWIIKVDDGKIILMNILYIDIEWSTDCDTDFLRIGSVSDLHFLCGTGTKIVLTSTDNIASLLFVSDISINKGGFYLIYSPIDGGSNKCGDILTSPSGQIAYPEGEDNYDNFVSCLWTVEVEDDYVIVLDILVMDIQKGISHCTEDYLEIFEDHKTIGTFCGKSAPAPFTTEANVLYLRFVSNLIITRKGFKTFYHQTQDVKSCSTDYHCLLSDTVILPSYLCDDYVDCPNGDDERFCDFRCPDECVCFGLEIDCSGKSGCTVQVEPANVTQPIYVPSSTRRLDVSSNPQVFKNAEIQNLSFISHLNLSNCDITELPNSFFRSMIRLKILDLSYNRLKSLKTGTFSSLSKLQYFSLVGNLGPIIFEPECFSGLSSVKQLVLSELHIERISQNAFANLNLTQLKIYHSEIDHINSNSLGGLIAEGVYLNTCKIHEFAETIFDGVQSVQVFKTDEFKFCCIRPPSLVEENCFPEKDEFSSCDDLIRNEILRPLIWIIGIFTVLTNFSTIIYRFVRQKEQLKLSYGIFVSNLAVSDGLMGIYLLIVAAADAYFRRVYIFQDEAWRGSPWCKMAGVLSTLSTEASVLFVCLITVDRFLVIKYPFGQVRLILKYASILSMIVWIIALVIAFLPAVIPLFEGRFYSQTGVCLALPISRARQPGWGYAVGVFIGFNSVAYFFVALGQWSIYKEIKDSSRALAESRSVRGHDERIARNLLLVVATDLLCWLPVGVLGILALADQAIEDEAYSWLAVVVLPVNAAVNPVLYTLSALLQKKREISKQDEEKKQAIFTSDQTARLLKNWNTPGYWQYRRQFEDYTPLASVLENKCLDVQQRVAIAREITKLLQNLHDQNLIQRHLTTDDVFVNEVNQTHVRVALVLTPKHSRKPADYKENICSLGWVLSRLREET